MFIGWTVECNCGSSPAPPDNTCHHQALLLDENRLGPLRVEYIQFLKILINMYSDQKGY